jgi:hypothetical protein
MTDTDRPSLDIREKLAHIDRMLADNQRQRASMPLILSQTLHVRADAERRRREIRLAPWQAMVIGMVTGAALFAAGAAFVKVLGS